MDRQIKSGTFPQALVPLLRRKKTDLFALWLDHEQSWDSVLCEVERKSKTENLARKQWTAVQAKTLKGSLSPEKYEDLIKKRTDAGLYYLDEDWPNDPMD